MTTKDFCLSLKGKQELTFGNSSNGCYSNFNLNQFNQSSNIPSNISSVQSQIAATNGRKEYSNSDFGERNNFRGNNYMFNSNNSFGTKDCLYNVRHDFNGKKEQRKELNNQNGNLTQHIASYESYLKSIGGFDPYEKNLNANKKGSRNEKSGSCNKWKSTKEILTNSSASIQNPFELPRGPKKKKDTTPEVAQFKSSQKILDTSEEVYVHDSTMTLDEGVVVRSKSNKKYEILNFISNESQNVFQAEEVKSKKKVVLKFFAKEDAKKCLREKEIYEKLSPLKSPHFINIIDEGERNKQKFLVLPLLDSTLSQKYPNRDATKLNNFTKVILAKQMLKCLETLHSIGVTHGDLKPSNFGILNGDTVILFDFERSEYVDKDKTRTSAPKRDPDCNATACYASLAFHNGKKIHFKDDIQSLCFLIAKFFVKDLPWMDQATRTSELIGTQMKNSLTYGSAFLGKLPPTLVAMFHKIQEYNYNKLPPYASFYTLLDLMFEPEDMTPILDWNPKFVYHGKNMPPYLQTPYFFCTSEDVLAQYVPPGDITTQPGTKIVFNGPYDKKQTYNSKIINTGGRRIGWTIKTTNMKRLNVDPPSAVLDPKEASIMAVSCNSFQFGQKDTNNDRITIEWTNTPDGAAKQFRHEWFQNDGIYRRKNLPIKYNL